MDAKKSPTGSLLLIVVAVLVAVVGYRFLTMPDIRSTTDKVSDAVHELPNGVDKAGRQLEDRTPGEKLGDSIKDTGDKVKDNTQSN
jgi:hypothetical protein